VLSGINTVTFGGIFEVFMCESVTGRTGQTTFEKEKHIVCEISCSVHMQINLSA
jgi:hypothetical protein